MQTSTTIFPTPRFNDVQTSQESNPDSDYAWPPPQPFFRRNLSSLKPPAGPCMHVDTVEDLKFRGVSMDRFDGILEALMNIGQSQEDFAADSTMGDDLSSKNISMILNK